MNKLPFEIINYIEEFKPKHPLENYIERWRGYKNKPTCYFYVYYFMNLREKQKNRNYLEERKQYLFKNMLEDGFTNEQTVKLNYKSKLEKRRMLKKLEELNIKSYEVKTVTHFPKLNKHGNFSEVYFNNLEIIF